MVYYGNYYSHYHDMQLVKVNLGIVCDFHRNQNFKSYCLSSASSGLKYFQDIIHDLNVIKKTPLFSISSNR